MLALDNLDLLIHCSFGLFICHLHAIGMYTQTRNTLNHSPNLEKNPLSASEHLEN